MQLLVLGSTPLFFSTRDGGWFPTLRLLHQYPDMMPRLRADKGAIKWVLALGPAGYCNLGVAQPEHSHVLLEARSPNWKSRDLTHRTHLSGMCALNWLWPLPWWPAMLVRRFVLSGANIMCPGLTSPGATIHDEVEANTPVAIYAEDREHAMAIGFAKMSTQEMREVRVSVPGIRQPSLPAGRTLAAAACGAGSFLSRTGILCAHWSEFSLARGCR